MNAVPEPIRVIRVEHSDIDPTHPTRRRRGGEGVGGRPPASQRAGGAKAGVVSELATSEIERRLADIEAGRDIERDPIEIERERESSALGWSANSPPAPPRALQVPGRPGPVAQRPAWSANFKFPGGRVFPGPVFAPPRLLAGNRSAAAVTGPPGRPGPRLWLGGLGWLAAKGRNTLRFYVWFLCNTHLLSRWIG